MSDSLPQLDQSKGLLLQTFYEFALVTEPIPNSQLSVQMKAWAEVRNWQKHVASIELSLLPFPNSHISTPIPPIALHAELAILGISYLLVASLLFPIGVVDQQLPIGCANVHIFFASLPSIGLLVPSCSPLRVLRLLSKFRPIDTQLFLLLATEIRPIHENHAIVFAIREFIFAVFVPKCIPDPVVAFPKQLATSGFPALDISLFLVVHIAARAPLRDCSFEIEWMPIAAHTTGANLVCSALQRLVDPLLWLAILQIGTLQLCAPSHSYTFLLVAECLEEENLVEWFPIQLVHTAFA